MTSGNIASDLARSWPKRKVGRRNQSRWKASSIGRTGDLIRIEHYEEIESRRGVGVKNVATPSSNSNKDTAPKSTFLFATMPKPKDHSHVAPLAFRQEASLPPFHQIPIASPINATTQTEWTPKCSHGALQRSRMLIVPPSALVRFHERTMGPT